METNQYEYDSLTKHEERGAIKINFESDPKRRPILYIDDADAGATSYFLSQGIPREKLIPVNWDSNACNAITSKTGVSAVFEHIDKHLFNICPSPSSHSSKCFSVVWLDYEGHSLDKGALKRAICLARVVKIVLNITRKKKGEVHNNAKSIIERCGGVVVSDGYYKGKSNVKNMLRITAVPRAKSPESFLPIDDSPHTPPRTPPREDSTAEDVATPRLEESSLVEADTSRLEESSLMVASRLEDMIGRTLYISVDEWTKKGKEPPTGLGIGVLYRRGYLAHEVVRTIKKKNRLKLKAKMNDGSLYHKYSTDIEPTLEEALGFTHRP